MARRQSRRWIRTGEWLLVAALLVAAAPVLWAELKPPRSRAPLPPHLLTITAEPLAGAGTRIGGVRLAGALALSSSDAGFGGLSGLTALPDGRLLAVSDAGQWLLLRPIVQAGRLVGVTGGVIGGLPAPPGGEKYDNDAEAVQMLPGGGVLVSFEQQHRLQRYAGIPPRHLAATQWHTPAMRWLANGGGEALAVLPDGALIWLPERPSGGVHRGLFITADGRASPLLVPELPGFAITEAALLDGRVLLLHRRFTGLERAAAISVIDAAAARTGTAARRLLLRWDAGGMAAGGAPWPIDNMEGAAIVHEPGGPVLYLVSDDNFSSAQQTLLLRLEVPAGFGR